MQEHGWATGACSMHITVDCLAVLSNIAIQQHLFIISTDYLHPHTEDCHRQITLIGAVNNGATSKEVDKSCGIAHNSQHRFLLGRACPADPGCQWYHCRLHQKLQRPSEPSHATPDCAQFLSSPPLQPPNCHTCVAKKEHEGQTDIGRCKGCFTKSLYPSKQANLRGILLQQLVRLEQLYASHFCKVYQ